MTDRYPDRPDNVWIYYSDSLFALPRFMGSGLYQRGKEMRVPFRFQASEYDCVPTTLLNALNYLCDRESVPPIAIQRIFMYCLDTVTSRQGLGHGTSGYAVKLFANWLNEYQTKNFRIDARYISGREVHLSQNNLIAQTLNNNGAVALRVKSTGRQWHYIRKRLSNPPSQIFWPDRS